MLPVSKRTTTLVLISAAVCAAWGWFGSWLVSLPSEHKWFSSFVEVAFAVNSSLVFEKIRMALLGMLPIHCCREIQRLQNKTGGGISEQSVDKLSEKAKQLYRKLEGRLAGVSRFISWVAPVFAIVSMLVLLTDCPKAYYGFVPLLVTPVILLFTCMLTDVAMVWNEFETVCEDVVEMMKLDQDAAVARQVGTMIP